MQAVKVIAAAAAAILAKIGFTTWRTWWCVGVHPIAVNEHIHFL